MRTFFKKFAFILLSSQIIYLLIHLQFLLGMPQAALSVQDSVFFFVLGIICYSLSNNKLQYYFIAMIIALWPIAELQYFYIDIFHEPFTLTEMLKFPTLIQVSTIDKKILYLSVLLLWISGVIYLIYYGIQHWWHNNIFLKIIPIIGILYCSIILTTTKPLEFWQGDTIGEFFFKGIISMIQSRPPDLSQNIPKEDVVAAFKILRTLEAKRTKYPISRSPSKIPKHKRPIVIIIFESFYDYKDFIPLFKRDPFPKKYRSLVNSATYTGPNRSYGSFDARFTALTGAYPLRPATKKTIYYQTLANILTQYGYSATSLEAVTPTYNLSIFYPLWGFEHSYYQLYGNDWGGARSNPNSFVSNISNVIVNTPVNTVPFYFGFTFLGHDGACKFTDKFPNIKNVDHYLSYFPEDKRELMMRLLKEGVFNAQRLLTIKKIILQKFPHALIVFKADHFSPHFYKNIKNSTLPQKYKDKIFHDPAPLPFLVFNGTNGLLKLPKGFSPANIPLMVLAESKLPYRNTTISLLYRQLPSNIISVYNKFTKNISNTYREITPKDLEFTSLTNHEEAYKTISIDLYKGQAYTLQLLSNKKDS